jgi:hypothetical protein
MSEVLRAWLLDKGPSLGAVFIAMCSLLYSVISARRTAVRSSQPVLVFEYADDGWHVENVGNGPAVNILLAFRGRGDNTPWKCPLRIPPLAKDAMYHIKELGKLSVRHLGASYTDSYSRWYSTLSVDDENVVTRGRSLPSFDDSEIIRSWQNVSFEHHVDLV